MVANYALRADFGKEGLECDSEDTELYVIWNKRGVQEADMYGVVMRNSNFPC